MFWRRELPVGPYFETLARARRLGMVAECSRLRRRRGDARRPAPLSPFESLAAFDLYAGDGHYLEHAPHDPMIEETRWPTGHCFALNLKSQRLFPRARADRAGRKQEHDLRALKRQSVALLRQGAGQGRKGMGGWDKAGGDPPFWQERKASGIYFLSRRKEGMGLTVEPDRGIDLAQPIHQGVPADRLVTDRRGIRVREITFCDPRDGEGYVSLTSEMTLEPGLLAWRDKTRWEIEKVFDETKLQLQEKKSSVANNAWPDRKANSSKPGRASRWFTASCSASPRRRSNSSAGCAPTGINPPRCRKPCSSYAPSTPNFNHSNQTPMGFSTFPSASKKVAFLASL
jgi:hypothetical protein